MSETNTYTHTGPPSEYDGTFSYGRKWCIHFYIYQIQHAMLCVQSRYTARLISISDEPQTNSTVTAYLKMHPNLQQKINGTLLPQEQDIFTARTSHTASASPSRVVSSSHLRTSSQQSTMFVLHACIHLVSSKQILERTNIE